MGVQEWLVLVCLLCTIMSVDGLQLFVLWESSLLLYPVFQTGVSWTCCKLSGVSWMTSVLLVNHQHWYIWGIAWQMCTVAWHYHPHQCQPCTWESQVDWVQSQQASGWLQRPLLLSLSEHQISQLSQDQLHSSCVWWLVILCEVMSAEQLQQHQPHYNGGSSSVPTSLTFFCLPPLLWYLGALSLGPLCLLRHLGFQCPFFPHLWHMSSHAGHEDQPGGWDFVQCPHECTLSAGGFLPWWGLFCFLMALTVFCSFKPMASRLSEMVMSVWHTSSILGVVAFRSSVRSFLMSSLSLTALTSLYWTFYSFSSSDGKLHQSARAQRWSTSSSGDSLGQMQTSSSW